MQKNTADVVTEYLRIRGEKPEVAYFGSSHFVIGWQVKMPDFELIYRVEDDELIICNFNARQDVTNNNQAVSAFIRLIHKLEQSVPKIKRVRGMFLDSLELKVVALRQRLAEALIYQGACWEEIDGDAWLTYQIGVKAA